MGLDQDKNQNLDPHRNLHLYHGEEEEEEEEEDDPERLSLRNPSTASFQELFNQNQLLYARRLGQSPEKRPYFPSPLDPVSGESASPRDKMRENPPPPPPSRLGRRSSAGSVGGEIVEVQGGHIVRATGRKDRHSKVCTAKGPRDRRVRLAAHTAIQFYDVQDRLGYDRPSKAVDWLIKKAKAAIDELAELPAWHPTASAAAPESAQKKKETDGQSSAHHAMLGGQSEQMPSFLPPSLDSDAIADTIKSFFPTGSAGEPSSSAVEFHNFSAAAHNNTQDLRLSLQSFQDPIMLHHHHHHYTPPPPPQSNPSHPHHSDQARAPQGQQHVLLSGTPLGFDGWPPPPPWNSGGDPTSSAGASFQFNSPPPQLFGGGQFFTSQQRGPLQSSNTPSLRAWMDPSAAITISMADHHHHPGSLPVYPSSAFGYSGFHIPARIQGEEEEHDGYSDKPSSASSDSRH